MNKIKNITAAELLNDLLPSLAKRGAVMAELHTSTEPKMRKTNNPFFGGVRKVSAVNVTFGANYQSAVNRRMDKEGVEGEFKAESTWYHVDPKASTIARHNKTGAPYVRAALNTQTKPTVAYEALDGQAVPKSSLEPFLQVRKASAKQERHGLEKSKQAYPTVWKVESVKAIKVDGILHIVTG